MLDSQFCVSSLRPVLTTETERLAMKGRQRLLVALGLAHAVNPARRSELAVRKFHEISDLSCFEGMLPKPRLLRPDRGGAIFSGNFPDWADKEIRRAGKAGVMIVTFGEGGYPRRLLRLTDPPPHLYVHGELPGLETVTVAVVGSRRGTCYGRRIALALGRELAAAGVTVVSGLARGIDTRAHEGALEAGGRTIGVLGTGIDIVYPREGRDLFAKVRASGALVTEFPFGSPPEPWHFPVRNRIIAALSDGVVVVEATRDSGSLITAGLAADIGVPVGAVPGMVGTPSSEGCNELIHDGAAMVRGLNDVIDMLDYAPRERLRSAGHAEHGDSNESAEIAMPAGLQEDAWRVYQALSPDEPRDTDSLALSIRRDAGELLGLLLELELHDLVERTSGGSYLRKR